MKFLFSLLLLGFFTGRAALASAPLEEPVSRAATVSAEPPSWKLQTALTTPIRGFSIETREDDEAMKEALDYFQSASLEGLLQLSWRGLGLKFERTLASADLGSGLRTRMPPSTSEAWSFDLLWNNTLYELGTLSVRGLEASSYGVKDVRPELVFRKDGARLVSGIPINSGTVNSLANFYGRAEPPRGEDWSADILYSVELNRQSLAGDGSLVPEWRRKEFGSASTLSRIETAGLGAGAGLGFTTMMAERSYFSMAGLLGGTLNRVFTEGESGREDFSGGGLFLDARMGVRWVFGPHEAGVRFKLDVWNVAVKDNAVEGTDAALGGSYAYSF